MSKEYQEFVKEFKEALSDEKVRNIMILGYNDDDKFRGTLTTLNELYSNGRILTNSIARYRELYYRAFKTKIKANLSDYFKVGNMAIDYQLYSRHSTGKFGEDKDFVLFYPVETVFFETKILKKFYENVNDSICNKNIFVTTNDHSGRYHELDDIIDETVIIDTTKEHSDEFAILKKNFEEKGEKLPY